MEILAPAGNMEALIAGVRCGADAVYLGLKDFSARRNADNFDREALKEAIEYCHIRGVKVYIAINTMIKESELSLAAEEAAFAYNCGADAFIVSDLGLISVLHKKLPEAVLHASTQMTVHSPSAIYALKRYGIKRVVLAREMSREEIKAFCAQAKKEGIEVEVFVHGALCMCVSGQCLLSSALGGRSGNRGLCAGPCRLEFSAKEKGRYDLSLKDLSLIDYLLELESLGITSAKIEGRMKRPEYVAAAVAACRASLDSDTNAELKRAIKDVFSRSGFTDGYYKGTLGANMFGIRTKEDVESANEAFSYIHTLYRNERQSVPLDITAEIKRDKNISVTLKSDKGSVSVIGEPPERAIKNGITADDIKAALSKLGGTPYFAKSVTVNLDDGLFLSIGALNKLRREAVEKLSVVRAKNGRKREVEYSPEKTGQISAGEPEIYIKLNNAEQIPEDISGVKGIILPFECDFSALPDGVQKIADLPRYITDESKVINRLKELKSEGIKKAYCGNLSAIILAKEEGFRVIASNGLNCANSESIKALKGIGADEAVLSAEINLSAVKTLGKDIKKGVFAYGRLPLMLTRNCPIKNAKTCAECGKKGFLADRKGVRFPVICRKGYSEVLNSTPIYLADKKEDLRYFDFLILNFTDESSHQVGEIINNYKCGKSFSGNFTRGLYYKNLP